MRIHNDFPGGNIQVVEVRDNTVVLKNELRDTQQDWFYWAFCVEGAQGREITFEFERNRLGYWGPAVSHDYKNWHWLDSVNGDSFTYKFGEDEEKVYFAHHMLYRPDRLIEFAKENGVEIRELCKSRDGMSVPSFILGSGEKSIIITARHHACESTGSYVMEGIAKELLEAPIENARALFVPFVDYDGVRKGDQGKGRAPYDHNRDYIAPHVYPETAAILDYAQKNGCNFGLDLHSPWHRGNENDKLFFVRNLALKLDRFDRFGTLFENEITEDAMTYKVADDYPPDTGWNHPKSSFGITMNRRPECSLALSLESAYFGTEDNKISTDRLIQTGRCLARAIKKYLATEE